MILHQEHHSDIEVNNNYSLPVPVFHENLRRKIAIQQPEFNFITLKKTEPFYPSHVRYPDIPLYFPSLRLN